MVIGLLVLEGVIIEFVVAAVFATAGGCGFWPQFTSTHSDLGGFWLGILLNTLARSTLLSMSAVERRSLVLRGVLDLCLLALLRERPVYGYELTERLAEQDLLVSGGSAYPLLARLEKAGLVVAEKLPSPSGPPRKYYSLSGSGVALLASGTAEWIALATSVTSLLQSPNPSTDNRTGAA
jgi:PadR family transcriptional regulator PadR